MTDKSSKKDLDRVGQWIDGVPYIWVSDGTPERSYRYYLTKPEDKVYQLIQDTPTSEKRFVAVNMYLIEHQTRERIIKASDPIYRLKLKPQATDRSLNLFRAYNTYFLNVPLEKVDTIDLRVNGEKIDPVMAFVSDMNVVKDNRGNKLIILRYLEKIPKIHLQKHDGYKPYDDELSAQLIKSDKTKGSLVTG